MILASSLSQAQSCMHVLFSWDGVGLSISPSLPISEFALHVPEFSIATWNSRALFAVSGGLCHLKLAHLTTLIRGHDVVCV